MMSFITEQEAIDNVEGFSALSDSDKARFLDQAEAYLLARNVKSFLNLDEVPKPLKLASYEIIKGIMAGKLYQGQSQTLHSKTVSAQAGTSVSKTFAAGSVELNAYEQYILDLIKPFTKRQLVQLLKRL